MAYFLFRAFHLAVKNSSMVVDLQDQDGVEFVSQQTSSLMLYVQEIARSGSDTFSSYIWISGGLKFAFFVTAADKVQKIIQEFYFGYSFHDTLVDNAPKNIITIFHYSGLFKNLCSACSDILKENLVSGEKPPQAMETTVKRIHEMCVSMRETQPVLCLQWIQLVFLFEFDDECWWRTLQGCYIF